jgi:WD40 repeat protein
MNTQFSGKYELLDQIAEEFAQRFRQGERPAVQEYTQRYPELAADIRELFPAMVEIERAEAGTGFPTAPLRQVGDYRVLREIGRGGMGVVYEAEQSSLGRRVALKVLSIQASNDAKAMDRFKREARSAAGLHHTNIVPVFEVGQHGDVCYYAMQFIQGQGLDQVAEELRRLRAVSRGAQPTTAKPDNDADPGARNREINASRWLAESLLTGRYGQQEATVAAEPQNAPRQPVPQRTEPGLSGSAVLPGQTEFSAVESDRQHYFVSIARIGRQVAAALAYAHERGIVHRDIKPSNLLLDASGIVWITDFGLAKTEEDGLTRTGDIIGTIRYMSPERFQGKCDARADVYSLGMTLYELLALRPAFESTDRLSLISRISNEDPARPRLVDPRIPRDMETIVLKAIAKDPARRYQTATEMAEDLRRFVDGEPIKARRTSLLGRARLWSRRNPALAGLYVVLLACGIGSTATAVYLNALLRESEVNRNAKEQAEQQAIEDLYASYVAQANASRFSRQIGQRFGTLEAVRKAANLVRERGMPTERLDTLRNLAIAALSLPDLRTIKTWERPGIADSFVMDDRSQFYARWEVSGKISLRRMETDELIASLQGGHLLRFSPGGHFLLACGDDHRFRAWDIARPEPQLVSEGDEDGFAFHPDGRHLAVARRDGTLLLYDLHTPGQQATHLATLKHEVEDWQHVLMSFDPGGDRLAIRNLGKAQILDARTGQILASIPQDHVREIPAWHPSGKYLALVCVESRDATIHVWDVQRMTLTATLKGFRSPIVGAVFTPDGDRLLCGGWENLLRLWDWRTGRQVLQHAGGSNLSFSSMGRLLIQDSLGIHLVELASGREYRTIAQESDEGKDLNFVDVVVAPDGRLLAANMTDGVRLFDLENGDELATVPEASKRIAIQSDGALLTNGNRGLLRWPLREMKTGKWQVGPPILLDPRSLDDLASDQAGRVIAQANGNGAIVVRSGHAPVFLGPHGGACHVAISPDGKYIATAINDGEAGVKVWDSSTRRLVVHLPMGRNSGGLFSPDGKWLAVKGQPEGELRASRVVQVGTWETACEGSWNIAGFSPDGALLAATRDEGIVALLEPSTGREVARFEGLNFGGGFFAFTPDGTELLNTDIYDRAIHVWDLRAVRTQLADLGLDWKAPSYPKAKETRPSPVEVAVVPGSLFEDPRKSLRLSSLRIAFDPYDYEGYFQRGRAYGRLKVREKAIADYSLALALLPLRDKKKVRGELLLRRSANFYALKEEAKGDAGVLEIAEQDLPIPSELQAEAAQLCNNVAWLRYLMVPEKQRDPKKALALAQKAIKLDPDGWVYLNTLGVASYRVGQYAKAVDTLQRSLRDTQKDAAAFDLFFLAMCHHRLGDTSKAREEYEAGVRWVSQFGRTLSNPSWGEELAQFQAEAKAVLAESPGVSAEKRR